MRERLAGGRLAERASKSAKIWLYWLKTAVSVMNDARQVFPLPLRNSQFMNIFPKFSTIFNFFSNIILYCYFTPLELILFHEKSSFFWFLIINSRTVQKVSVCLQLLIPDTSYLKMYTGTAHGPAMLIFPFLKFRVSPKSLLM